MSGRRSRGKGVRVERSIVYALKASGIETVRAPLSGAAGARLTARSRLSHVAGG
jgi:Holliday junction resolvase